MKIIARMTAGLFLALAVTSCGQDDEENLAPIEGKWRGTLAEAELQPFGIPLPVKKSDPTFDTELEFRANGTLLVSDGAETREGTWKLVGNRLATDIDFDTEFIEVSGTYTVETLTSSTLIFFLEKEDQTVTDPGSGQSISGDLKITLHFERM